MPSELRRDALLGSVAGLIGGFIYGLAFQARGMMGDTAGLLGLTSIGAGFLSNLIRAAIAGAICGWALIMICVRPPIGYPPSQILDGA